MGMRSWLREHFPRIDREVDRIVYWAAFFVLVWSIMTWVASSLPSGPNIAVAMFIGLGVSCLVSLTASAALVATRFFRPLPPAPAPATPSHELTETRQQIQYLGITILHLIHITRRQTVSFIIEQLLINQPELGPHDEMTFSDSSSLKKEAFKMEEYCKKVASSLSYTDLRQGYASVLHFAAIQSDSELHRIDVPRGAAPFDYRNWFIARAKVRDTIKFLEAQKHEIEEKTNGDLSQLREREQTITRQVRP